MSDYIKRLFNMLIAAILAHANRLAHLAAIRHEMEAYAAAYDEANLLEAAGKPELARFARAQIEETLGSARAADVAPQPAVNGDGEPHPFGLPRPTQAALGPQQGRESTTAPRRAAVARRERTGQRRRRRKRRRRIRPGRPTRQRRPRSLQISTLNKKRDSHGSQATDLGSRAGRPARPRASPAPRRTALAALRGPRDAGPRPPRQAAQSRAPHSLPVTS